MPVGRPAPAPGSAEAGGHRSCPPGRRRPEGPPRARRLEARRPHRGQSSRACRSPGGPPARRLGRRSRGGPRRGRHPLRRARPGGRPGGRSWCSTPTQTPTRKSACPPGRPPCSPRSVPAVPERRACSSAPARAVDMVSGRPLITLSREAERAGWAPIEVLDARDEDPRAGGYPAPAGGGDQGGGERGAAAARRRGAQPEGSGPPARLQAMPEPAALRGVRGRPRPARAASGGAGGPAPLPAVRLGRPGPVRHLRADQARHRAARRRPRP